MRRILAHNPRHDERNMAHKLWQLKGDWLTNHGNKTEIGSPVQSQLCIYKASYKKEAEKADSTYYPALTKSNHFFLLIQPNAVLTSPKRLASKLIVLLFLFVLQL